MNRGPHSPYMGTPGEVGKSVGVPVSLRRDASERAGRGIAFGRSGISLALSCAERCPGAPGTMRRQSPGRSGARSQTVFEREEVENEC